MVGLGVERDRGARIWIDLVGGHAGRAALRRRDGDQPRAGGQVQDGAAADQLLMIEKVAGQRLAAGPREGPERRRRHHPAAQFLLGALPQRERVRREVQPELGKVGRDPERGVRADKVDRVHGPTLASGPRWLMTGTPSGDLGRAGMIGGGPTRGGGGARGCGGRGGTWERWSGGGGEWAENGGGGGVWVEGGGGGVGGGSGGA